MIIIIIIFPYSEVHYRHYTYSVVKAYYCWVMCRNKIICCSTYVSVVNVAATLFIA